MLSTAWRLYKADAPKLWQALAVVVIPLELLWLIVRTISVPSGSQVVSGKLYYPAGTAASPLPSLLTALILLLVTLVSTGAVYRLLLDRYLLGRTSILSSYNFALDRALSLFWLSLLMSVFVMVGFVLFVIPGIYLLGALSVAVPVLMAEDLRGLAAMRRSRELVRGNWWRAVGLMIAAGLIAEAASFLIGLVIGALLGTLHPGTPFTLFLISAIAQSIAAVLVAPFTSAVVVVLYVDLLARHGDPMLYQLTGSQPSPYGAPSAFGTPQHDPGGSVPPPGWG